jgi:hypothetical protein
MGNIFASFQQAGNIPLLKDILNSLANEPAMVPPASFKSRGLGSIPKKQKYIQRTDQQGQA